MDGGECEKNKKYKIKKVVRRLLGNNFLFV